MSYLRVVVIFVILIFSTLFIGCTRSLSDYQDQTPAFDLATYFNGPIIAWGMVEDHSGKVTRRFCVEMTGTWQNNQGLLAETFYFDDGEESIRNWRLKRMENGSYQGGAEDVIGQASGVSKGFAFRWQYTLAITLDDNEYHVSLDDWLYQLDEYRLFNKTDIKKFGITVGKLTIFFDKQLPLRTCK